MYRRDFRRKLAKVFFVSTILVLTCPGLASAAERYTVTGKIANIRSGPGTEYDIQFQAEKYYPVNILKKSGNWFQIKDFEGDVGWIHQSLVSKIPSVITIKKKCNVRSGPGTDHKIKFVTERGVPFKVLKRKGNWLQVQHADGYEGWIHQSLVW